MKKSLISDLYHNYITETEQPRIYFLLLERIDTNTKKLKKHMNNRNKKILQRICDDYDKITALETDNAFADGFSFAMQIMLEAFNRKQKSD